MDGVKKHYFNEFKKSKHLRIEAINTETHKIMPLEKYIELGKHFNVDAESNFLIEYLRGRGINTVAVPIISGTDLIFIKPN